MKKIWVLILMVTMTMAMTSCRSSKPLAETNTITKIEFGNGGGFTGFVTTSTLTAEGMLVKPRENPRRIAPTEMDSVLALANKVTASYVHPSNTYVFVDIYRQNDTIRCSWSFGDKNVNQNVQSLYYKLTKL